MQWLRSRIAQSPRRALVIGKAVFLAGAILILGAVFARASLLAINAERAEAKLPLFQALAQAYPQHPTWIVPEGPLGFSIATVLVVVGLAVTVIADEASKRARRGGP
jgi:hypothetical protein